MDETKVNLALDIANSLVDDLAEDNLKLRMRLEKALVERSDLCEEIDKLKAQVMDLSWTATVLNWGKDTNQ